MRSTLCTLLATLLAAASTNEAVATRTSFDVTEFESKLLPKWLAQFQLNGTGKFSYIPHAPEPHPYATSDVAHVLCFTNQLTTLSDADKDSYAARINQWQRDDGFFDNGNPAGGSLWHAAGYVPAGLHILERQVLKPNILFDHIASTPVLWQPTVQGLLDVDAVPAPENITSGCSNGYSCAQNIASLVAWQVITNNNSRFGGGMQRYRSFVDWYLKFLRDQADPSTGLWCTPAQKAKYGTINCIGGSFHIDFVFQFLQQHPSFNHSGNASAFPFAEQQLNHSLALQQSSGGWTTDGMAYLNVDGLYEVIRPSLQIGKYRWPEVESACSKLMGLVVPALNNETRLLSSSREGLSQNTHQLPALVAAVAECQKHFPSMVHSGRPWRMCLDSTPYI